MIKIGILGGGQLARMLALAGAPLEINCHCYAEAIPCSASYVCNVMTGRLDNHDALNTFIKQVDVITFENENISVNIIEDIAKIKPVYPSARAINIAQDRLLEKNFFKTLNIPTVPYEAINSESELVGALKTIGLPAVLKTRRMGYDGKGQVKITEHSQAQTAWKQLNNDNAILEAWLPFDDEISMIAVRSRQGEIKHYPLSHNVHENGILLQTTAPFIDPQLEKSALNFMTRVMEALDYVGVLAIEFFVKDNQLYANEMAPRVHNSGHWTQDGAVTSQFENHLRAVCNLPIGSTEAIQKTVMKNCIGTMPELTDILKINGTHYHSYQKEPRPGRKLGHINYT